MSEVRNPYGGRGGSSDHDQHVKHETPETATQFVSLVYVVDSAEAYVFADADAAEKFAERYTDAIVTEEPVLPTAFLEETKEETPS